MLQTLDEMSVINFKYVSIIRIFRPQNPRKLYLVEICN